MEKDAHCTTRDHLNISISLIKIGGGGISDDIENSGILKTLLHLKDERAEPCEVVAMQAAQHLLMPQTTLEFLL